MANETKALLLAICFLTLARPVVSWGQQIEPFRFTFSRLTSLKAKRNENQDEGDLANFRQILEHRFAAFDGDSADPMASFMKAEEGELAIDSSSDKRALDRMYDANPLSDQCEGDYCDLDSDSECEIPESFKIPPGKDAVDVMNFLGIRRAEPLRVNKDVGEWE